ncbi:metalloregulator ArsR/SmtB family transcription factor [Teredinibacter franksiae]|uniref:metalloregulator ArsR/SmtB family transcription factor n=1 Tax=Teredinibacter franksiae TaxID=2761453 RepID=UPI001623EA04|nr:metalloregulator ArsR/SmtB family transcription factor [Teredinibacter franksiae]
MTPLSLFKCFADETRQLSTLLIARQGELCVCELMLLLDESQPKISRHLAQLRKCGVLADRRHEQWVFYRLHPQLPVWAQAIVRHAGEAEFDRVERLTRKLSVNKRVLNRC